MSDITTRLAHCLRTLLAVPNADSAHAARTTLAEYEASVAGGPLPIGTRIRMLENRSFWKAGEVTELVSCLGWGDADSSMDTGGDYWARGNRVERFCTSRNDFEVLAPEYAP